MNKKTRYSPEVRERAVRLVFERQGEHESQWAAINSIASKIGCTLETLRKWVRRAERDQGLRAGMTSSDRERLKALERALTIAVTARHAVRAERQRITQYVTDVAKILATDRVCWLAVKPMTGIETATMISRLNFDRM